MDALELLYDYFEDRAHASALIRQRRPIGLGAFGAVLGASSLFVAQAAAGRFGLFAFTWPSLGLALLWQVALTFLWTALLHLFLELTGARGDAGALLVHLGLSELAWVAAVPAILLVQAATGSVWGPRLVFAVVGLWSLTLKARGIRDEYHVGGGRAWLTLCLPYAAVSVFVMLAAALFAAGLVLRLLNS